MHVNENWKRLSFEVYTEVCMSNNPFLEQIKHACKFICTCLDWEWFHQFFYLWFSTTQGFAIFQLAGDLIPSLNSIIYESVLCHICWGMQFNYSIWNCSWHSLVLINSLLFNFERMLPVICSFPHFSHLDLSIDLIYWEHVVFFKCQQRTIVSLLQNQMGFSQKCSSRQTLNGEPALHCTHKAATFWGSIEYPFTFSRSAYKPVFIYCQLSAILTTPIHSDSQSTWFFIQMKMFILSGLSGRVFSEVAWQSSKTAQNQFWIPLGM